MIGRMGNGNGDTLGIPDPVVWVIGGTAAAIALYYLTKSSPGVTQAASVAPKEAPAAFADMNAVAVRVGQVRDLWTMGYLNPQEAIDQLTGLATAIAELQKAGKATPASAQDLVTRIDGLLKDVTDYQKLQASPA
jgi:hypothetical protein